MLRDLCFSNSFFNTPLYWILQPDDNSDGSKKNVLSRKYNRDVKIFW